MSEWTVIDMDGELFEIRPYKKPPKPKVFKSQETAEIMQRNYTFLKRILDRAREIYNYEGYKEAGVPWRDCINLAGQQLKGRINEE